MQLTRNCILKKLKLKINTDRQIFKLNQQERRLATLINRQSRKTPSIQHSSIAMGHEQSKSEVKQIGDQQVTVIEKQEVHTEALAQSDLKLWIILTIVAVQVIVVGLTTTAFTIIHLSSHIPVHTKFTIITKPRTVQPGFGQFVTVKKK